MTRRTIATIAGAGLLLWGAGVSAATLTMQVDDPIVNVTDTVMLTLEATISPGEVAPAQVFVVVRWGGNGSVAENGGPAPDAFTQFNGAAPAVQGGNQGNCEWALGRTDQCLAFDQLFAVPGQTVDPGTYTATLSYTALTAGSVEFSFQDAVGSDFNFFDLGNGTDVGTAPPGVVLIIPEPTTATLLGLGLAGLALRGRGRG